MFYKSCAFLWFSKKKKKEKKHFKLKIKVVQWLIVSEVLNSSDIFILETLFYKVRDPPLLTPFLSLLLFKWEIKKNAFYNLVQMMIIKVKA